MNFERAFKEVGRRPQQVVTLVFLSKHLPIAPLSEELARSLHAETRESVVLVRVRSSSADGSAVSECRPPALGSFVASSPPGSGIINGANHAADGNGMATAGGWAPSEVIPQAQFRSPFTPLRTEAGLHLFAR